MKVNQAYIVIDVETGGFSPQQNLLTQIAFIIIDGFTLEELYSYNTYIYPYDDNLYISKEASKLTGITKEKLLVEGKPLKNVLDEICNIWKGFKRSYFLPALVSHNGTFDTMYLEDVFNRVYGINSGKNGVNKMYDFVLKTGFDTMLLARQKYIDNELPNFKLETIGDYIGSSNYSAHDALADIRQTADLFRHFIKCLRNESQSEKIEVEAPKMNFQF